MSDTEYQSYQHLGHGIVRLTAADGSIVHRNTRLATEQYHKRREHRQRKDHKAFIR